MKQTREEMLAKKREYYLANYDRIREYQRQYRARPGNPERSRTWARSYYARNRDRIAERNKATKVRDPELDRVKSFRARHGMLPEDWIAMWEAQAGRCYLCGDELSSLGPGQVHVDHDHGHCPRLRSCSICRRGLACGRCNSSVGYADDDPARLRRMADALEVAQLAVQKRRASSPAQIPLFKLRSIPWTPA